jgi:hypothetical protein
VHQASGIEARVRLAVGLPETLAAGFDAFEAIRMSARAWQDRVPELFAAFMTAADAAVGGREALTIAPSSLTRAAPSPAMRWRRAPIRVRPPTCSRRSHPRCVTGSPVPLPWPTCPVTGPRARTPRRRPGESAS